MSKRIHNSNDGGATQISRFLYQASQSELPSGGPSALESAFWSDQFQPIKRRIFFNEEVAEDTILDHMRHDDYGLRMFEWGTAHGYPEHAIRVDGRVASVIATGRRSWVTACMVHDTLLMAFALRQLKNTQSGSTTQDHPGELSLDREIRDEVIALGGKRGWWYYFARAVMPDRNEKVLLDIVGGEENWRRFARCADIAYVSQMRIKLRHQAIRDALYEKAGAARWPKFCYSPPSAPSSDWIVTLGGEPSWRYFCAEKGHEDFQYVYEHLFKKDWSYERPTFLQNTGGYLLY